MFDQILGIPAHPLIVHAAVVFVPLQVVAGIVYGVVPVWRRYIGWAVVGLAIVAPAAAWAAKFSGESFEQQQIKKGASGAFLKNINTHSGYAGILAYLTLGLGIVMLVLVWATRRNRKVTPAAGDSAEIAGDAAEVMGSPAALKVLALVLTVVVIALGGVTGFYIFKTGDTGAHLVYGIQQ